MAEYSDICRRWDELGDLCEKITPTRIPLEPRPSEILALGDDIRVLCRKVDALVETYGEYVSANAPTKIDLSLFRSQLLGALEGNALYEIECAADELRAMYATAAE